MSCFQRFPNHRTEWKNALAFESRICERNHANKRPFQSERAVQQVSFLGIANPSTDGLLSVGLVAGRQFKANQRTVGFVGLDDNVALHQFELFAQRH